MVPVLNASKLVMTATFNPNKKREKKHTPKNPTSPQKITPAPSICEHHKCITSYFLKRLFMYFF